MIEIIKTQIFPNKLQRKYFEEAFGIRRYVWNMCIDRFIEADNEFNENDFKKELNRLALTQEYDFFNNVNSMVRQETLKDFKIALKLYKNKQEKLSLRNISDTNLGRPTKRDSYQSFRYNNKGNPIKVLNDKYFYLTTTKQLKRLKIKTNESLMKLNQEGIRFAEITIKRDFDGRYYANISFERANQMETKIKRFSSKKVGIDMGIKTPLTCVDFNETTNEYEYFEYKLPKTIHTIQNRIEYETSKITKKKKGSNNYFKHKFKIDKLYRRLVNIRKEFVFQTVSELCKTYETIIIEDFVFNYHKTGLKCNKTMSNIGKYRFMTHLHYKSEFYGNNLDVVKKGFPSTQTCSCCGHRFTGDNKLTLKDRVYKCPNCGLKLNRDINAAINIYNYK